MKFLVIAFALGFVIGQYSQDHSLKMLGFRVGIGRDGYSIQDTSDWRVIATGWFPWHKPSNWIPLPPGADGQALVYKDGVGRWQTYDPKPEEQPK